jgi:hypothetical protein
VGRYESNGNCKEFGGQLGGNNEEWKKVRKRF